MNKLVLPLLFFMSACGTKKIKYSDSSDANKNDTQRFLTYLAKNNYFDQALAQSTQSTGLNIKDFKNFETWQPQKDQEDYQLYKLYFGFLLEPTQQLNALKDKMGFTQFKRLELSPIFIPDSRHKAPNHYNKFIYFFGDSSVIDYFAFRPIEVDTGCESQCLPVVFHLVYRKEGYNSEFKIYRILQEPKRPLTKVNHQTLSSEDLKLLFEILNSKVPDDLLKWGPSQTTDLKVTGFGQTWTFLKPFVVPGGAYTSYRIYEAGFSTVSFLNNKTEVTDAEEAGLIRKHFIKPLNIQLSKKLFESFYLNPRLMKLYPKLFLGTLLWNIQNGLTSPDWGWIQNQSDFRLSEICLFQAQLLQSEKGQVFYKNNFSNNPTACPAIDYRTVKYLTDLAPLRDQTLEKILLSAPLPRYISSNSKLFLNLINKTTMSSEYGVVRSQWLNDFVLKFPKLITQLTPQDQALIIKSKKSDFILERFSPWIVKEKTSKISLDKIKLVKFTTPEKTRAVEFRSILKLNKIRMIVLFSSGCPHCVDFLLKYKNSELNRVAGKQILFAHLGYSLEDSSWTKEFCRLIQFGPNCADLFYQIDSQDSQTQAALKSLDFRGTPHIILLNRKGEIVMPAFPLDIDSDSPETGRDLFIDLQDLFESL
jgi:hypothetical protein